MGKRRNAKRANNKGKKKREETRVRFSTGKGGKISTYLKYEPAPLYEGEKKKLTNKRGGAKGRKKGERHGVKLRKGNRYNGEWSTDLSTLHYKVIN